ncbi:MULTISPECIES: hypothetical protein [unclassified Rhizobium]|uniref:hypothetical protein n=1 Tax=unclassified Rhizobium TaxID=2613769 RepID=UPI001ADC5DA6|nr:MULTISPECIES: hypothetical protein [unclassified Rhizobium]MBO9097562.1 hypothetical protein [Rhizobium sp. L58/93]MBO9183760.1 hypothetical protein [Rhizobium sp. E27B/91]QXZ84073.1 hypothetical protein J5287_00385 [Rhizobium sp. K1/93]QXZ88414.1 hypothetical protein J5280_09615 [Rhizobium sp. K15/93]QYA00999.1 hypothetical protein J5278_14870 [Rhizobium sp. B21/90]
MSALLTVTSANSRRIRAFRASMIDSLPRVPNNKETLAALWDAPVREVILDFLTWRQRFVPARPRMVRFWSGGVTEQSLTALRSEILPLLKKAAAGGDLTPHLSKLVNTKGLVLSGANPDDQRKHLDGVLIRNGLHHFHIGTEARDGTVARSDRLVFAHVLKDEFRVVSISDHDAFEFGTDEHERFFSICQNYISKDLKAGEAFMVNPVMSSGHDMQLTLFSRQCEAEIASRDPTLDDPAAIDRLYDTSPLAARPKKVRLAWHFEDLKFGLLEKQTRKFFCIYPFFDR